MMLHVRPVHGFTPEVDQRRSVDVLGYLHPFTWASRLRCRVLSAGKTCVVLMEVAHD